jgi:predicted nucleotidyltransferase
MIARIVEVLHPEQVWLFGSRARGEARVDSDWDFMAILADDGPEQDFDLASVWQWLRDLRLRRVEVFTMTRGEFANGSARWARSRRSSRRRASSSMAAELPAPIRGYPLSARSGTLLS